MVFGVVKYGFLPIYCKRNNFIRKQQAYDD